MQLTVRRRQTLCAWFGLYNVACFHLKHFMPRWWSLSTWLPRVYRAEHITPSQSENFNPQNTDRIHERSSKNGGGVYAAPHHTREEIWERAGVQPPNEHSTTAGNTSHSFGFDRNFSLHFAWWPLAGANKCCVPSRGAGRETPNRPRASLHNREGNRKWQLFSFAILVLHTHKQT